MKKIGQFFSRMKERKGASNNGNKAPSSKESNLQRNDFLQLGTVKEIQDLIREGEFIILSDHIEKYNHKEKKQKRTILITNCYVYNLKGLTLRRKIEISKIKKIITSRSSGDFILKVPEEYDYRYVAQENKKQLIIEILCSYSSGLQILYADQAELVEEVTTKREKISQMQQQQHQSSSQNGTSYTSQSNSNHKPKVQPYLALDSNSEISNTQNTSQKPSLLNTLLSFNLFSHSTQQPAENMQAFSKEDVESTSEKRLKRVPSFERVAQRKFNDFELIDYLGYCNAWRYFLVKECGSESKKVYQMRVINVSTHLKMDGMSEAKQLLQKQFVEEQIQLMKELDSSYFSQQYYFISQGNYFAALQEELYTSKYVDLAQLIDEQSFLPENVAKVIAAQIAYSLHILHSKNIVYNRVNHKDIKIDLAGNTILTRFEFSKYLSSQFKVSPRSSNNQGGSSSNIPNNTSYLLPFSSGNFLTEESPKKQNQLGRRDAGFNQYQAPELINNGQYSFGVDWWGFGILLYEMLLGFTPFFDQDPSKLEQKILKQKDIDFPKMANISPSAKNLIIRCLDKNPKSRIKGLDVLNHDFFSGINGIKWGEIKERVPQFEVSQLFNFEKQLSEELSTTSLTNPQSTAPNDNSETDSYNCSIKLNLQEVAVKDFKEKNQNGNAENENEEEEDDYDDDEMIIFNIRNSEKNELDFNITNQHSNKIINSKRKIPHVVNQA